LILVSFRGTLLFVEVIVGMDPLRSSSYTGVWGNGPDRCDMANSRKRTASKKRRIVDPITGSNLRKPDDTVHVYVYILGAICIISYVDTLYYAMLTPC
jgi:hypothetical protein